MPHVTVKPFNLEALQWKMKDDEILRFFAKGYRSSDIVIGVMHEEEEFLLQVKPKGLVTLLKYDKVTRPLKVTLLKEALEKLAKVLKVEILSSNITISSTKAKLSSLALKKIEDFETITYPKEKVSVEVGFGSGKHLIYQALKNPDTLFIGLEIHTPSAQQVLKQIALQNIENIWVVNYDARLFLEMLPSNLCENIFVHFPVPWDKKPQRRVISKSFLSESMRVLKEEGYLELRTDSNNYFWYALETFFSTPKAEVTIRKNEALEVTSKYESRWLKQEKDIYDVFVKSKERSLEKNNVINFEFEGVKYLSNIEEKLPKKALVFENYFIHFERIYKINITSILIKCAFGSFDRPEHKYILLENNSCRYFSSLPVKTQVNLEAHLMLCKQLSLKDDTDV